MSRLNTALLSVLAGAWCVIVFSVARPVFRSGPAWTMTAADGSIIAHSVKPDRLASTIIVLVAIAPVLVVAGTWWRLRGRAHASTAAGVFRGERLAESVRDSREAASLLPLWRRILTMAAVGQAAVVGLWAWTLARFLLASAGIVVDPVLTAPSWYAVTGVAASGLAAWGTLRLLRRNEFYNPPLIPRQAVALLAAGYLFTWAFGVPAAQTAVTTFAVREYKRMLVERPNQAMPSHPLIVFGAAVPVLPGLIVSYHEYQVSGLYGFGGWVLHFWYGWGTKELYALPVWLS